MNRLTESGAGIIMISSELPELLGMSDRILVMRGGRIQDEFDATVATQEKILSAALGLSQLMRARRFGTVIGLLVLCAVLWALTPHFLTVSNLLNIVQQTSINAIVAAGMTFVIISGGIDLSVGSIVALSGVVLGSLLQGGQPLVDRDSGGARRGHRLRVCSMARWSASAACRRSSRRSA